MKILSIFLILTFGASSWANPSCDRSFSRGTAESIVCESFAANGLVDDQILLQPNYCALTRCDINIIVLSISELQRFGFKVIPPPWQFAKSLSYDLYQSSGSAHVVFHRIAEASIQKGYK
jgi:hypothetical protein